MTIKNRGLSDPLTWASALAMLVGIYMAFIYAPTERIMGDLQRIFYFHVPSAWVGFFAFSSPSSPASLVSQLGDAGGTLLPCPQLR